MVDCFHCGITGARSDILIHAKNSPAKITACSKCGKVGHSAKVCKAVHVVQGQESVVDQEDETSEETLYNVNIFRVSTDVTGPNIKPTDFKVQVLINSKLDSVLCWYVGLWIRDCKALEPPI